MASKDDWSWRVAIVRTTCAELAKSVDKYGKGLLGRTKWKFESWVGDISFKGGSTRPLMASSSLGKNQHIAPKAVNRSTGTPFKRHLDGIGAYLGYPT